MSSREPAPMSRAMLRERQARLAQASTLADRGDLESAARIVERVLAEDADYGPALALRERLRGAGIREVGPGATGPGARPVDPPDSGNATLPGTNVSAGSWAQFQRRMQLRRETTCLAAMRRAMDAGDYRSAHERAIELATIDPSWDEVRLFLEDMVANAGRASDAEPPGVERATPDAAPPVAAPAVVGLEAARTDQRERIERTRRARRRERTARTESRKLARATAAAAARTVPATVPAPPPRETPLHEDPLHEAEMEAPLADAPIEHVALQPRADDVKQAEAPLVRASFEPPPFRSTQPVAVAARDERQTTGAPPAKRRLRWLAAVALTLLFATLAGWTIARVLPDAIVAGWLTALGFVTSAPPTPPSSPAAPPRLAPAPIPEAELPRIPLDSAQRPLPFAGPGKGNDLSQNRNLTAADAGGPAPLDSPRQEQARPQPAQEGFPGALSQRPTVPPPPSVRGGSQTTSASESSSRPPLVTPDTAAQIRTPPAGDQRGNGDARPPESRIDSTPPSPAPAGTSGTSTAASSVYAPPPSHADAAPPSTASSTPGSPSSPPAAGTPPSTSAANPSAGSSPATPGGTRDADVPNTGETPAGARATTGSAEAERAADESAVRAAIGSYARAYTALNAAAVRRVWPSVNEEALRNAFGQLRAQQVAFTACAVNVAGLRASATCRGTARYVPRVGSGEPISAPHLWQFGLRKVVDVWVIDSATIQ